MANKPPYREWLKQDLSSLIDQLIGLDDLQKHFLRSRWLDQVLWMEGRADDARIRYYLLRLTAIIFGLVIPVLVSLNIEGTPGIIVRAVIIFLGLLVAISGALEEFFRYGERWRHYRQNVEWLKIEGWRFFQLSDPYRKAKTHTEAYPVFADRIEDIIRRDVNVYVSEVVRSQDEKEDKSEDKN